MNTFFDKYGSLNTDEIIVNHPSFIKIMEDGVVTETELEEQGNRVLDLLRSFEKTATDEQIECIRLLLAEMGVLQVARMIYEKQMNDKNN